MAADSLTPETMTLRWTPPEGAGCDHLPPPSGCMSKLSGCRGHHTSFVCRVRKKNNRKSDGEKYFFFSHIMSTMAHAIAGWDRISGDSLVMLEF